MVNVLIFLSPVIAFLLTFLTMPFWIRKARGIGLVWEDMNKPTKQGKKKKVAGSGGIVVVMAFIIGVLYYIAVRTFLFDGVNGISVEIFAMLSVVLILTITGIIDDLLGWRKGGLSRRTRLFLAFVASIPLVVINAGNSAINLPFLGSVDFGLLYPLLLVPIGIAGATTTYNFLAGFNGLEAGQGILILGFLSYVSYATGSPWLSVVGLIMVAALFGFLFYNKFPAKVFPGDSLTWTIGSLIAGMAILGNFEKIAIFVFIPYVVETGLKIRGKLKKQSFGKPNKDGSLDLKYNKIYGLEHLAIYLMKKARIPPTEQKVVYSIWAFQLLIIALAFVIFL